ncbi:MAG: MFS transporter [Paracoccaceae bacterium]|jgi:MFS family permease|nr:MFS transporter [Marinovum sp.]|tara:strand:+ start:1983 stop:3239 length:1257 start_codon:yes stop_codon:yes gene_type:complete
MFTVLGNTWALMLGMMLLMVGNGLQGTLIGIRGEIEGFSTIELSIVMSAYFVGFLGASQLVPELIRRVGHVRVFAALASFISAVLIAYPLLTNPIFWSVGRVVIGFCYCGVYITAESWLNNSVDNEKRGQALSLYMIVQMVGIVSAQGVLALGNPNGYSLFIIISILVSISFAPILLSISPAPAFERTKLMTLSRLFTSSPLACVGMFLLGGVFSAQFGMSAVFGAQIGLSLSQISLFVASFYIGAMIFQYPIGWVSDKMDRRLLILLISAASATGSASAYFAGGYFFALVFAAFLVGGLTNPLYSLLIAHANDFIEYEDMASAAAGLLFVNGVGAVSGPIIIGYAMNAFGPEIFFVIIALLMATLAIYAGYRMTQRATVSDTSSYAAVLPNSTGVAVEIAQEFAFDVTNDDEEKSDA